MRQWGRECGVIITVVRTRATFTATRFLVLAVLAIVALAVAGLPAQSAAPGRARMSEEVRTIPTYPFSEPNPVPILAKDARLYPYFSFEGYAHESMPKPWKVVKLENDWIEVLVLPEVGGKVWGARVKKTGHDFIYRNEVLKFRNVALRGPWTSGGIEFNFGVVGHTPSTATPVDYALRENADGSVSCIVGTMDLPSRTEWRVEIRLPADRAAFDTNVLWHNPTPLEQPYYNWMTAAAFAKNDLTMTIPGNAYLDHPGPRHDWPVDAAGHFLPGYANNQFGSNKSFHVVGELNDVFGGYYADAGFGFGHWARHEDMPGQKLWLWALSRAGGIWEDLLTDKNGQYVEYQAGRLLVQYTPGADETPIRQAGFDPFATDRWSETWFPIEGIGGLTEASHDAAIAVKDAGGQIAIGINSFIAKSDTLRVWMGDRVVLERPVTLSPLEPLTVKADHPAGAQYRVELAALGVRYSSDPNARELSRPFTSEPAAATAIPEADRLVFEAEEQIRARRLDEARPMLEKALALAPFHHDGLLAMADLEYRRARYAEGLAFAMRALRIDTYDAAANFAAGNLYRALGKLNDSRDAYGWAARSLGYRTAANTELAELAMGRGDFAEAERYARMALDFNRNNLSAWEILASVGRVTKNTPLFATSTADILARDPLHHTVPAERYLAAPSAAALDAFTSSLRSEFPDQSVLELAIDYVNRGRKDDAIALLDAVRPRYTNPLIRAWLAYLKNDPALLAQPADVALVFPYRLETLPVLTWAAHENTHWSWAYLAALNLWGFDRTSEAAALLKSLGDVPDAAVFYVTRATLAEQLGTADAEADLRRAAALAGRDRILHLPLIQFLQNKNRWADALMASTAARALFPADFNLDIMQARSLVHLDRPADALAILDATQVLPSEGARESHQLYVQAHVEAALAGISANRLDDAYAHLTAALEWPEHLGQGKPYDPEERLLRFLMARIDDRRGRAADAKRNYQAVADATRPAGAPGILDLLAIPALASLGASAPLTSNILAGGAVDGPDAGIAATARALATGAPLTGLATRFPRTFGDLDASLILRAFNVSAR
jgi:tetratricopeptide (TPR) repeat protein